jgi:hypothetical protein
LLGEWRGWRLIPGFAAVFVVGQGLLADALEKGQDFTFVPEAGCLAADGREGFEQG